MVVFNVLLAVASASSARAGFGGAHSPELDALGVTTFFAQEVVGAALAAGLAAIPLTVVVRLLAVGGTVTAPGAATTSRPMPSRS